ncbi:hypothetical protein SAMN05216178_0540 [Pseudomonas saponiphila]|uniref:Uncharacterized protein n=1 Tax=Pseudomonas saponiphila TaxID=556534 RepID=A0A1H4JLE1_9PSED|nr:hypothetical protein SAMN05216178_0540 [Pseudomonas saponiphila]
MPAIAVLSLPVPPPRLEGNLFQVRDFEALPQPRYSHKHEGFN